MIHWMRDRMFPEVTEFPAGRERETAWRIAYAGAFRGTGHLAVALAWLVLFAGYGALGWLIPGRSAGGGAGSGSLHVAWRLLFFCVPSVGLTAFTMYWGRTNILRGLRRQLNELGKPRCIACGYDLTGNESGTCPECGRLIIEDVGPAVRRPLVRQNRCSAGFTFLVGVLAFSACFALGCWALDSMLPQHPLMQRGSSPGEGALVILMMATIAVVSFCLAVALCCGMRWRYVEGVTCQSCGLDVAVEAGEVCPACGKKVSAHPPAE